jgi:hypothetical protein
MKIWVPKSNLQKPEWFICKFCFSKEFEGMEENAMRFHVKAPSVMAEG